MPTIITTRVMEESTAYFTVSFTDEDDQAVIPNSITWSLTDSKGTIINSRDQVAVGTPAASIAIELAGDDLALPDPRQNQRRLLVEAVYNTDKPLKDSAVFMISNLAGI